MIKKKITDKKFLLLGGVLFFLFALLAYLFPYSGDDWAWGSSIGVDRLSSWFHNYNGRYAGNLLVMTLTRSKLLQVLFVALSMLFVSIAPKLFNRSARLSVVIFSACLLLLVPKQIFVQSLAWTAGYSNYVPPILLTVIYFVLVRNIFEDEKPEYSVYLPCAAFVIGFISALFMENLTLYNLAVSFLIIAYVWFRFKKIYVAHAAHFFGCLTGAIMMFTNSAYRNIANNTDSYRSTALSKGIIQTIGSHCEIILEQFFYYNFAILLVISILCVVLTVLHMKNCKDFRRIYASWIAIFVNVLCLGILYAKDGYGYWVMAVGSAYSKEATLITMMLAAIMYCFAVLLTVLLCVTEKNAMFKMLMLLVSVPIVIAPLVLVNPIGPRCFFPPYVLLILFAATLLHYIQEAFRISETANMGLGVSMAAVGFAMLLFFTSIYGTIHSYDEKRKEYVEKQAELGYEEITMCKLPYGTYVWYGDPTSALWEERFKLFYDVDLDAKLKLVTYAEFDKWIKEFDLLYAKED